MCQNSFLFLLRILIIAIFLQGCSVSSTSWQETDLIALTAEEKLQTGDILITPKYFTDPLGWYGHSALMISDNRVGEYPKFGVGYSEVNIHRWLAQRKKVAVLRYTKLTPAFKAQFLKNLKNINHKDYGISLNKKNSDYFYCSSYVWYTYYKTALDLGYALNLDSDNGYFVMPYDILAASSTLKPVQFP